MCAYCPIREQSVSHEDLDARHVTCPSLLAPVILVISSCPSLSITRYSWAKFTRYCKIPVYTAIGSRCLKYWCVPLVVSEIQADVRQLQQYIARIQLLNAGLLEEAHNIANLFPCTHDPHDEADNEPESQEATATKVPPQTAAEYIVRIRGFVKTSLHVAKKKGIGRYDYKDGLVFQERREVLDGVFKTAGRPWRGRCTRCNA